MVAAGEEVLGQPGEDAAAVVADGVALPCTSSRAWPTSPPNDLHDRLVAEADAESRDPDGQAPQDFRRDACLLRSSGSR